MLNLSIPLTSKDPGGVLRVIMIGRISTPQQNLTNIDASFAEGETFLRRVYQGPIELKQLGEQGSGLRTDRETIREAEDEISTGRWDLVIMEDLSRAYRNPRFQFAFVQNAVDHDTRVICLGDNLDTADPQWEVMMGAAVLRHGLYIPDTRRRVRRTATHSFHSGGMVQKVRFGYRKLTPEEADSGCLGPKGLRIAKRPEATPIIREMRDRLLRGECYEAIADWLNGEEIDPGSYVTSDRWTGRLVKELLRDPILSGTRTFRDEVHQQVYESGKYRRLKNSQPETEQYPELAHLSLQEQQELWAVMDARKEGHGQKCGRDNPLTGRARAESIWPGQHARCGVCGGLMYRKGGDELKCENAFKQSGRRCWNRVQFKADEARSKILPQLLAVLERHPLFRETLTEAMWTGFEQQLQREQRQSRKLDKQIDALEKRAENLGRAIQEQGVSKTLYRQLTEVEDELEKLVCKRDEEQQRSRAASAILTREEVASRFDEALQVLAETSFKFSALMRQIFPVFLIQPVQALDTPQVRPRAKLVLEIPTSESSEQAEQGRPVRINLTADLFRPPDHIGYREECLAAKRENPKRSLKKVAELLRIGHMTVKRALDYTRRMEREGLTEPYRELNEEPQQASRWNPRKTGVHPEQAKRAS